MDVVIGGAASIFLLWCLCFKSLELHQLALVISFLFVTGRTNDIGVVVSFLVVGLCHGADVQIE